MKRRMDVAQILQGLAYKVSAISPKVFAFEIFALVFGMSPITLKFKILFKKSGHFQICTHLEIMMSLLPNLSSSA